MHITTPRLQFFPVACLHSIPVSLRHGYTIGSIVRHLGWWLCRSSSVAALRSGAAVQRARALASNTHRQRAWTQHLCVAGCGVPRWLVARWLGFFLWLAWLGNSVAGVAGKFLWLGRRRYGPHLRKTKTPKKLQNGHHKKNTPTAGRLTTFSLHHLFRLSAARSACTAHRKGDVASWVFTLLQWRYRVFSVSYRDHARGLQPYSC